MSIEEFAADLADMCSRSPVAPGRPLTWTIIANPKAGGFTIGSRWRTHRRILKAYAEEARRNPIRGAWAGPSRTAREADGGNGTLGALGLVPTRRPAHAGELVKALLDEAEALREEAALHGQGDPFHLIITAGGDGTSLEALTALYHAPAALRSSLAILRLPMGTGNDGADGRDLDAALDLLVHPTRVVYQRAVRLRTSSGRIGPFLAFNILSVGLDAFVTHMTNLMKGKLPGDSYKLWVDIATLFYDRVYTVAPMEVDVYGEGEVRTLGFRDQLLLLAFGATGRRTYGANKPILPNDHNVCAVSQMPLLKKIALKSLFTTGRHADRSEARLFDARAVVLRYGEPILAQMDGEAVRLEPEDFPVTIELTDPVIPALKHADG